MFSSTLRCGIRAKDWNTMLIFLRRTWRSSRSEMAAMSSPSISTWPRVGSISRLKRRTRVDLPEPERPITTKISPSWMARLTS
ncbi:hypothetical protein D1872_300560 [compost metagenome]